MTALRANRHRTLAFLLVGIAALSLWLLPFHAAAQPYPNYDFQIRLDAKAGLLQGKVRIQVTEEDPRPRNEWWLRLPPNRFAAEDRRGERRHSEPLPIGFRFSAPDTIDPLLPNGFSEGDIRIHSVQDDQGRPLSYDFQPDPEIPPGYWRENALLRVGFQPASSGRAVTIRFTTRLPEQYVDGRHDGGIVAELWHPVLLPFTAEGWERDPFAAAGGTFAGRLSVAQPGLLLAGDSEPIAAYPGAEVELPATGGAKRTFPLVFSRSPEVLQRGSGEVVYSVLFEKGNERAAELVLEMAEQFFAFSKSRLGLPHPAPAVNFVQSDMRLGEILTVGGTVVIPTVFFKNDPILDRVFVGKLARAMAEIWFGEGVWSNRDTQAWLHLGLTGYLALEFFRFRYGWDASIHDLVDWLSPKYREHFFEAPVLAYYRDGKDQPLNLSLYHHPARGTAMVTLYQKAPLVFRSLAFVLGESAFNRGLILFFRRHRQRAATIEDFRLAMVEASGRALKWYFDAWFYGTTRVDYALENWEAVPVPRGYRVTVEVARNEPGVMPVDVQVQTTDGGQVTQRWSGVTERTTMVFEVSQPVERIVLDPEEYLIETNRQNNHSSRNIRLRPFYDWAKERESLVTIVARLGGNAIDGNIIGLGANIRFDTENSLSIIPIFAEKTSEALFEIDFKSRRFLHPRLTFLASAFRLGGRKAVSSGFRYRNPSPEDNTMQTTYLLTAEEVEAASLGTSAEDPIQQAGTTNNVNIVHEASFRIGLPHSLGWTLDAEHSRPAFGSDFEYSTLLATFSQTLDMHVNHAFNFEFIRGFTDGDAPIQKLHLLGDPLVLRGFPRTVDLVSDNIAALRTEYRFVLTRTILGETVQTRKITLILFADVGKGWNNEMAFSDALTRRDAGVGINIDFNTLNMLEFPLRVEIAWPIGDPVYKDRQFILFQALAFF